MKPKHVVTSMILLAIAVFISNAWSLTPEQTSPPRTPESDRQTLIALENEWLTAQNASILDRILASDFLHPVPSGDFLTKSQHIEWFTKHLPPVNLKFRFGRLDVRLYGDFAIANGSVITSDENGKEVSRNVFTDVFTYRDGRWQAINAQETDVRKIK